MSRAIMISIQPKWVEKILNGKKTIEIRKTMPKCEFPIDAYIYCTYGDLLTFENDEITGEYFSFYKGIKVNSKKGFSNQVNGKVVAKFTLKDIDDFYVFTDGVIQYWSACDLEKSCVPYDELANYIGRGKNGYSWHIDKLEIFDNPKELGEFTYRCVDDSKCENCPYYYCHNTESDSEKGCSCDCRKPITKAPQSWQFVEVEQ